MGRDDDDRRRDGEGGPVDDDPFSLDDIVVPDDARALQGDVRALRRERRASARRVRLARLLLTRRWQRYGVSGPIVVVVLVLVAAFASLMVLFQPRRPASRPVPLAIGVRGAGQEGGLLPDVQLTRADGTTVAARELRPAVFAVVPSVCGCEGVLHRYGTAIQRHHLAFLHVGTTMPALPPDLGDRWVVRASDGTGALLRAYHVSTAPVLLLVRADGVVNRVLLNEPTPNALNSELAVLVATGSSAN
jgi:hypothetical protein